MESQDYQIDEYLDSEDVAVEYPPTQNLDFDEGYFEKQRIACGLPPAVALPAIGPPPSSPSPPPASKQNRPSTSGTQKPSTSGTQKPIKTTGGTATARKRICKLKLGDHAIAKRSISLLPTPLPIPAPTVVKVIQGAARTKLLQVLISEAAALEKPKKFYDLPEGEYLIHHIGEKLVHAPYPPFQIVFGEYKADGVKNYVLVTKPFTALSDELRGTISPPLTIFNKHIEGKKFTEIKFLG
jgi:hypothetical protein